ncbi:uncharacterized protein LOC132750304 [Ruditapes philippinarum]|uniref:uncharacterized protein LOC132750304 n=1 Tax=Ruditapes philippinarum TaxID=129788 RepID=UPI00295AA2FF|nr:uncharacterized protein LOC132750304 [Ruditapes philippinarum]
MDFRVFPELKSQLRGKRVDSADDLVKHTQAIVSSLTDSCGADVSIQDVKTFTPLLTAIRYDSLEVFQRLTDDESIEIHSDEWLLKALEIATKHNSKNVAKDLIQRFEDSNNVIESNYHDLVYLATVKNSDKVLEGEAADEGAESEAQSNKIQVASIEGAETETISNQIKDEAADVGVESETISNQIQKKAVDEGAESETQSNQIQDAATDVGVESGTQSNQNQTTGDMSQETKHDKEPFHVAAEKGYLECLIILMKPMTKEDLCTKGENGKTALHLAAAKGRAE